LFWNLESLGITESPSTCDDDLALDHFNKTVKFVDCDTLSLLQNGQMCSLVWGFWERLIGLALKKVLGRAFITLNTLLLRLKPFSMITNLHMSLLISPTQTQSPQPTCYMVGRYHIISSHSTTNVTLTLEREVQSRAKKQAALI